uniref:Uncharacterized protein n=1 Tax=Plectus sambesii TaxID=2011161 RepID=A0A914XUV9_9BILA
MSIRAADIKLLTSSAEVMDNWKICEICGDRANSRHYGAMACNGCKAFFRRSIWNNRQYRCRFKGTCAMLKELRTACKACRLKKCLDCGMDPRELLGTRKAEAEKTLSLPEDPQNVAQHLKMAVCEIKRQPMPHCDPIDLLTQIDRFITARVDPSIQIFVEQPDIPFQIAFRNPSLIIRRTQINCAAERIASANDILDECRRMLVLYIDWLHSFDDFQSLPAAVQIALAKARFSNFMWLVCAWRTYRAGCPGVCNSRGSYFPCNPQQRCLPDLKDITSLFMKVIVEEVKRIDLDETEFCLLKAIDLFNYEAIDELEECEKMIIGKKCDKYIKLLYEYILNRFKHFNELDVALRVGKLMQLLVENARITLMGNSNIAALDAMGVVELDQLNCEVFVKEASPTF